MVTLRVTLSDPQLPQTTPICTFCTAIHIFVAAARRDFKFGIHRLVSVRENVCNNSKKRKKLCFLKSEKNVKKRRPTAYVQFHIRPLKQKRILFNTLIL